MSSPRQERNQDNHPQRSAAMQGTTGPTAAEAALKRHRNSKNPKLLSEEASSDLDSRPQHKTEVVTTKRAAAKWKRYVRLGLVVLLGTLLLGIAEGLVLFNTRPPSAGIPKKSYESRDVSRQATEQIGNASPDGLLLARIADLEKKLASVTRERDVLKEALLILSSED